SASLDRIFVGAWGSFGPGLHGMVYAISRSGTPRVLGELRSEQRTGDLFYDEQADSLGLLSDEGERMIEARASTLTPTRILPVPIIPGAIRYDSATHDGLFCFAAGPMRTIDGGAFMAVAFHGVPFSARPLAPSSRYPWTWLALSWGCDWDSAHRNVYVTTPNLGLLTTIDHASGNIQRNHFVGFGLRSVAYDSARNRLYAANFLRGDVQAFDPETGRPLAHWFVGRFVRDLAITRDGHGLLASSTVGVIRINLDDQ
ncbi:MAG: hypothetical protein WCJ30_08275, partial [Deltaproteobacteria bacterium]